MQIYICDDNDLDRERVCRMLTAYAGRFKSRLRIRKFKSAKQMLAAMQKDSAQPDLVFLDIYMDEMDGIEADEKLMHLSGGEIPVIFSTSSEEHAIQAFQLRAAGYLHKPYTQKEFDHALKRVEWMFRDSGRYLEIWQSGRECTCKIWLENILWLETEGRGTRFYLDEDSQYRNRVSAPAFSNGEYSLFTTSPLKTFRDNLSQYPDFYECGRSCILHLTRAECMEEQGVRMKNGALIPVPVRLRSQTAQRLQDWKKKGREDFLR